MTKRKGIGELKPIGKFPISGQVAFVFATGIISLPKSLSNYAEKRVYISAFAPPLYREVGMASEFSVRGGRMVAVNGHFILEVGKWGWQGEKGGARLDSDIAEFENLLLFARKAIAAEWKKIPPTGDAPKCKDCDAPAFYADGKCQQHSEVTAKLRIKRDAWGKVVA